MKTEEKRKKSTEHMDEKRQMERISEGNRANEMSALSFFIFWNSVKKRSVLSVPLFCSKRTGRGDVGTLTQVKNQVSSRDVSLMKTYEE